ncbi:MAG: 23S rRNA (adenine(2030)-N(6))-methyltransferase RlmJ [Pseudomonadota bacterium]|nr:23S rRNA (adenine(2030)-N(6))-methyltransferase RlmJ [Pseudomonadota bacterium]
MNYRHIYHAGGFSDVFKHVILTHVLLYLRGKDAPFCVLDTHAGIGVYDLDSPEALKTGEAQEGIHRLLACESHPEALKPYIEAVLAVNGGAGPVHRYPGSPALAHHFLRPGDRLVLAELHPADARTLKRLYQDDPRVATHSMDGYTALKAHLPPVEKRGAVLTDPSFEVPDEFSAMAAGLVTAWHRWPGGTYMLWYPVKERATIWRFEETLIASGIRRILKAEMLVHPEDDPFRLNGCGMIIVNPPWQLKGTLEEVLPFLCRTLAPAGQGSGSVTWLVPE